MPRQKLSTETDRCGSDVLRVQSVNGLVEIRKGQSREIFIPNRRFVWFCDRSKEFTTAPRGTNFIIARRASTGREITWECFKDFPDPGRVILLNNSPFPNIRNFDQEGIKIRFKSFKRDAFFYREIGGTANFESNHVADLLVIQNTYLYEGFPNETKVSSFSFTKGEALREFGAFARGTKFPVSVITEITIIVNNIKIVAITQV